MTVMKASVATTKVCVILLGLLLFVVAALGNGDHGNYDDDDDDSVTVAAAVPHNETRPSPAATVRGKGAAGSGGGSGVRPFVDHPTCPRKEDMTRNRKCLKKCRSDLECRGRNRRCLCDDVCGKSCVRQTLRCESPKTLLNGKYELTPFNTFGARLRYTCDVGYVLVGPAERVCQGDGYWNGEAPTCQKVESSVPGGYQDENRCGDPPAVDHASRDGPVGQKFYPLGTQLTYTCATGYSLDGFFRTMCVGEGRWIGPRMTCSPRRCGHPGETPNGQRDGNVFVYPNRVRYSCNEGYEMVGRPYRVCQADGQWSGSLPTCRPVRCTKAQPPANGHVHGTDFTYGALVTVSCLTGFRLEGSSTRKCQQDGRWSGREPVCVIVDCGRPGTFYNGYIEGQQTTFGSTIVFRCFGRSTFVGESTTATCQENGLWSHPVPKCLSKCEVPAIQNGSLQPFISAGTFVNHGNVLHYGCSEGFTNDSMSPECTNGTWTVVPQCVPAPCKERPPEVKYGIVRFHTLRHGDRAKYKCNTGFELVGDMYLTCLYGQWKGVKPICEEVYCKYPGPLENGQLLLVGMEGKFEYRDYITRTPHNDQFEYHCNKDYVRVGPAAATCVGGEWSPPNRPSCVPKQHPPVMYIFRGRRQATAAAADGGVDEYYGTPSSSRVRRGRVGVP